MSGNKTKVQKNTQINFGDDNIKRLKNCDEDENDATVTVRNYGCYKLGILVALVIILILLIGTVPALLTIQNRKVILIITCITLVIVAVLLFLSICWQNRKARQQRQQLGRSLVPNMTHRNNGYYTAVPSSLDTSWSFWSTTKSNKGKGSMQRKPVMTTTI